MSTIRRRQLLKTGATAVGLAAAPFIAPRVTRAATAISFASWGGSNYDFQRKYLIEPFTAETGIPVNYIAGPDLAKVKAQVDSNNVTWDVVDGFANEAARAGLAEPIDYKIIDATRFAVKPRPFAMPVNAFVGGIAYDPARTKPPAQDFSQFWDVKNFPGRRALRNRASEMLELALVADGVAPNVLYPLDLDRAFRSLNRLKPQVRKWFAETAQGLSLIQTNEVEYTYTYLNRVGSAKKSGVSIEMSMAQNIVTMLYVFVPKGSPRKESAMRFLEFMSRPQIQATMVRELRGVYPAVKGIEKFVESDVLQALPPMNSPKNVFLNDEYWTEHFLEVDKRFKEWTLT